MNSELLKKLLELKMTLVDELVESLPAEQQEKVKKIERELVEALVVAGQAYLEKTSNPPNQEATKDKVTAIKIE